MVTGIALLDVITAALASWFIEKVGEVEAAEKRTRSEVAELVVEIRALRADVAVLRQERANLHVASCRESRRHRARPRA